MTMVAPAVVEQQAKLGVSAEESKAERLKRQQARFRDRGGVFVPSTSNPLVDILLARTVSGESPSKPHKKNAAKRPSPSKPRRSSPTRKAKAPALSEETQAVARSSKSKAAPRKGKTKAAQPEIDPDSKPAPKRRGRPAQSKKKAPDPDSDMEQLPPTNTKSKRTTKGNGKQRVALSTSDGHPKAKSKPKPAKEVVEVYDSDRDQTVDVPHKRKSKPKKIIPHEDDDETDDDAPIIKKCAKAPDSDSDVERLPPANTKSRRTLKGDSKQQIAPSTSDVHSKAKSKPKIKTKPPKEVVEVFDSDHNQTVDVPRKPKSNPNIILYEDDDESDDDALIIKKRAVSRADDSKSSGAKAKRVKTNGAADTGKSGKKTAGEKTKDEECSRIHAKKRLVSLDEEDDELLAPPSKKGQALASTKPKSDIELEPLPCPAKGVRSGGILKATGNTKGKGRSEPVQNAVELVEIGNDERPPEHLSKPKKRKKEDNYDDRPRKVVKFSEPDPPHSHKLKENQPDKKRKRAAKSRIKDEPDAPQPELGDKPPARAKSKGPPRKVLARIKASAARHLCCNASEPDELDCLS